MTAGQSPGATRRPPDNDRGRAQRIDRDTLAPRRKEKLILSRAHVWLGRDTPFRISSEAAPFDRRLEIEPRPHDRWIVLSYRSEALARPSRPLIRFRRGGTNIQVFPMPGVVHDRAHWLGLLPPDLDAIHIAAEPGFVLERVGLRGHAGLFAECLAKRPLRAVPALYNHLRGDERRFRDIIRGACAVTPRRHYPAWRAERLNSERRAGPESEMRIRLILPGGPDRDGLQATIDSLLNQTHRAWQLVVAMRNTPGTTVPGMDDPRIEIADWDETLPLAALLGQGEAIGMVRAGESLAPQTLATLAEALSGRDRPDMVYGDDDGGGDDPVPCLKPDWSPDLALVTAYPGSPSLISRGLIDRIGDLPIGAPDGLDLSLAVATSARRVVHVPRVLCRRAPIEAIPAELHAQRLDRQLRLMGVAARAEVSDGVVDLVWPLPDPPPLASIVIPSRDRIDLIARIADDVLAGTEYPSLELIIVDNGSTDIAVLDLYERLRSDARVRILPYEEEFNFAAMVNAGVDVAKGRVVVLLNNDIAVLRPDWLGHLVAQACRPEIGAVGAKLLYGDGSLQHAGVVVGLGGRAGHILRRRPADSPGHLGALRVAHEVSAVTAACLAVERKKYQAIGGFDARTFPIDFNDVDFCLRLGAAGYKTIWTPKAVLSHLESVSRGPAIGAARDRFEREAVAFEERWLDVIRHDPFYHPALSLTTFGEDLE